MEPVTQERSDQDPTSQTVADVMAAARKQAGMTQRELARRLARVHSFVARTELGGRQLKVWELFWYARGLGRDPIDLLRQIATLAKAARSPEEADVNQAV